MGSSAPPALNTSKLPKKIRPDHKSLGNIPCAAAYYTIEAILQKDALHPPTAESDLTYNDVCSMISDFVLDNKHKLIDLLDKVLKDMMIKSLDENDEHNLQFFNKEGDAMKNLSNAAYQLFLIFCDTSTTLDKDTNGHYELAKTSLATEMSNLIPIILSNSKSDLTSFITTSSRATHLTKDLITLIIKGANFDNKWLTIIHDSMPTAKSSTSTHTLANTMNNLQKDITHLQSEMIETENQITKISIRIGDLKTSELESRYHQVENIIKLNNINSIDEGTPNNFKTLSHSEKTKRINQLINNHISSKTGYSTHITTPSRGNRQLEPIAIISFCTPSSKYEFEKNFANFRKNNPSIKVTTSRQIPPKNKSDRDIPDENDIKQKIGMLYNTKILEALRHDPQIGYKPLNQDEIDAIQVQLKTKKQPFSTYWEFLCPSNNTTFMAYTPCKNPFTDYDFGNNIANPLTKMHAVTNPDYIKRLPPKMHNKNYAYNASTPSS